MKKSNEPNLWQVMNYLGACDGWKYRIQMYPSIMFMKVPDVWRQLNIWEPWRWLTHELSSYDSTMSANRLDQDWKKAVGEWFARKAHIVSDAPSRFDFPKVDQYKVCFHRQRIRFPLGGYYRVRSAIANMTTKHS